MADKDNENKPTEDIQGLRHHLFETIKDLRNADSAMDVETAKAIKGVADTIIDSAKTEVKAFEVAGIQPSEFINPALRLKGPRDDD